MAECPLRALAHGDVVGGEPALQPGQVELDAGERLPEPVVDFERDAAPLLFAYDLKPVRQLAQLLLRESQLFFGPASGCDIALYVEVTHDASLSAVLVEAYVVPLHPDRRSVDPTLVRFHMQSPGVEEAAPGRTPMREIEREQVIRGAPD